MNGWRSLAEELRAWRERGARPAFWWRDDDATRPTPALERLLALARACDVPLAIAVIPQEATLEAVREARCVLMHGCDHRNRAGAGEKKTEFAAAEGDAEALERLARARERLARLAGERFLPVLVPPWNRLRQALARRLPEAGIGGLSRYGARGAQEKGVREVNAHVDVIAWRGERGFVGEETALALALGHLAARRSGRADAAEPTGILTHHAVHDEAAWRFLERLFDETRRLGAQWADPRELFLSSA